MSRGQVSRGSWRRRLALFAAAVLAGTATLFAAPLPAAAAIGDPVLFWNDVLLRTYRQVGGAPTPLTRAGAMMHGAMYDALNSISCVEYPEPAPLTSCIGTPYRTKVKILTTEFPHPTAALNHAAYDVLRSVFPTLNFDADLSAAMAGIPNNSFRTQGISVGQRAATGMLNWRIGDGSTNTTPYTPGTNPGDWRPTGSGPAATPNWGLVRPFAMTSGSQFRPPLPGGFGSMPALLASSLYANQVNEVKELGRETSATRTAEQTQIAWFWANDVDGTYKPPGQHFAHTQILARQRGLSTRQTVRLFALVAIALADAAIAAWDSKYLTPIDLWRPETAIRLADTDGNPATVADPAWEPLSQTAAGVNFSPPFPAYVAGHAIFGAAWAGAMRGFFGTDAITFTATTEDPHAIGVTRTFSSFTEAAVEDGRSRVYLGVHYQFDSDFGLSSGFALANHVTTNFLVPPPPWVSRGFFETVADCEAAGRALVAGPDFSEFRCRFNEREFAYQLFVR